MKKSSLIPLAALLLTVIATTGCVKDQCTSTVTYISFEPVYVSLEEVHTGTVTKEAPRTLSRPGQIYYFNNTMYVVEQDEGIHVIDNADPSNPHLKAFIKIPGNKDIAIKDGLLYANSYVDMLVVDLDGYEVVGRTENIFQPLWEDIANNRILVDYKELEVTEVMDCRDREKLYERGGLFFGGPMLENTNVAFDDLMASSGNGGTGIAGSLAHFSIIGDYLYTIQHSGYTLDIFNLSQPTEPALVNTVQVGFGLETLFPYGDKLFIGSNIGMYIYDNSDPANPTQLGAFEHARACDPVFVAGNYAYVTLWDGSECGAGPNQLDVIDITDLTNPVLRSSFEMDNPHGLSVKGNTLLLCEGDYGLKSFDNTDPLTVGKHLLGHVKDVKATDVISLPGNANVAMVIGEGGFYQYSFDDPAHLQLLSVIPVSK